MNGAPVAVDARPDTWATLSRTWQSGDIVEIQAPLALRMEPVDRQHPNRVAVMRGPVVFVLEGAYHDPNFALPRTNEELAQWLVPEPGSLPRGVWATALPPHRVSDEFARGPTGQAPGAAAFPAVLRNRRELSVFHVLRSRHIAVEAVVAMATFPLNPSRQDVEHPQPL